MKYFKAVVVVSLIFLFPAVSYLYLRSGFIFRKEALEELDNAIPLTDDQQLFLLNHDKDFFTEKAKLVNLYMEVNTEKDEKDMYFLAGSMKARKDFSITAIYKSERMKSFQDTLFDRSINRVSGAAFPSFIQDTTRFLLTKDDVIRKVYGHSQDQFNLAYEHMVILLPMKKREKLTLIRDDEK